MIGHLGMRAARLVQIHTSQTLTGYTHGYTSQQGDLLPFELLIHTTCYLQVEVHSSSWRPTCQRNMTLCESHAALHSAAVATWQLSGSCSAGAHGALSCTTGWRVALRRSEANPIANRSDRHRHPARHLRRCHLPRRHHQGHRRVRPPATRWHTRSFRATWSSGERVTSSPLPPRVALRARPRRRRGATLGCGAAAGASARPTRTLTVGSRSVRSRGRTPTCFVDGAPNGPRACLACRRRQARARRRRQIVRATSRCCSPTGSSACGCAPKQRAAAVTCVRSWTSLERQRRTRAHAHPPWMRRIRRGTDCGSTAPSPCPRIGARSTGRTTTLAAVGVRRTCRCKASTDGL